MKKKYSQEIRTFIAENVKVAPTKVLVELVNATFDTEFTVDKMDAYKKKYKLKSGTPLGVPAGLPTALYPEEVKKFILKNYIGTGWQAMADLLNQEFGTSYTKGQMTAYYKNHKLDSGLRGHFKRGGIPYNKGLKGLNIGGEETQFKPGRISWNYLPVGTERTNTDGYVEIKIADLNKWKGKHRIIWAEAHGPVPKGYVVLFADGNRQNVVLENLLLVSRAQLATMNQRHLIKSDPELTRTGAIIADIYNKIGKKKLTTGKREE